MRKPRAKIATTTPTAINVQSTHTVTVDVEDDAGNVSQQQMTVNVISEEEGKRLATEAEALWRSGRIIASAMVDTYDAAINALTPVPVFHPMMQTMGVDKYYRCYFSPTYVMGLVEQARAVSKDNPCKFCGDTSHHPLAFVAGDVYHEAQHCLRQHGKRAESLLRGTAAADKEDEKWNRKMNIAADMEIDDDAKLLFKEAFDYAKSKTKTIPKICYCKNDNVTIPLPSEKGLEDNSLMEFYYRNMPDPPPQEGGGKGRQCGSGATGQKQAYEQGGPSDEEPGMDAVDQIHISKQVAKAVQEHSKTRGMSALGNMLDWANEILPPASYDWKKEFAREVKSGIARIFGHRNRNFNRPNKKSASVDYAVIYPKLFTRTPRLLLVLDTSGSMFSRTQNALAEIESICASSRASLEVHCVDWDVYDKQSIRSVRDLKIKGGGGTSMKRGIEQIMESRKFRDIDLMVLVTDGETDYPDKSTLGRVPLIVAVINESRNAMEGIPAYIKGIYVPVTK